MTLITKPDFTYVWASGGAVVAPNDAKKQLGWVAEAPPFQYDNWLQNRQDQMLAHINQRGIPVWDALTNYEAGSLSYVQGSDGKIYKSVAASGPSSVVSNPTTDLTDTYWVIAFADNILATETVPGIVELATALEAQQFVANKFIDGAKLEEAFKGSNVSLAANGYQKLPSGLIIQWGEIVSTGTNGIAFTFPIAFPNACYQVVLGPYGSNPGSFHLANLNGVPTLSGGTMSFFGGTAGSPPTVAANSQVGCRYVAIGR